MRHPLIALRLPLTISILMAAVRTSAAEVLVYRAPVSVRAQAPVLPEATLQSVVEALTSRAEVPGLAAKPLTSGLPADGVAPMLLASARTEALSSRILEIPVSAAPAMSDTLRTKAALDGLFENAQGRGKGLEVFEPIRGSEKAAPNARPRAYSLSGLTVPSGVSEERVESSGAKGWLDRVGELVDRILRRKKDPPADDPMEGLRDRFLVTVKASTRDQRTKIAELGVAIERIGASEVQGTAHQSTLDALKKAGFEIVKSVSLAEFKPQDFPQKDAAYHNYDELNAVLRELAGAHADRVSIISIGKSLEGRDIQALRFNTSEKGTTASKKPGIVFMGMHHSREHLSVEVPLKLAKHLAESQDPEVVKLLQTRDIYVIPMVNPDGAEYDIKNAEKTNQYKMWRKNTRDNGDGSKGVDLNRNYGFMWGTGGSSKNPSAETYMGPKPFSEVETQNVKRFVEERPNLKILLSFHTFSELILYPWGHKYDPIEDAKARQVYETMAKTMAQWNGYTPEQSSELYIASGDTTDWAWGEKKVFSFTFELTPKSMWDGGFYPGAGVIDSTFQANLKPALYLIDLADNPYRAVSGGKPGKPGKTAPGSSR